MEVQLPQEEKEEIFGPDFDDEPTDEQNENNNLEDDDDDDDNMLLAGAKISGNKELPNKSKMENVENSRDLEIKKHMLMREEGEKKKIEIKEKERFEKEKENFRKKTKRAVKEEISKNIESVNKEEKKGKSTSNKKRDIGEDPAKKHVDRKGKKEDVKDFTKPQKKGKQEKNTERSKFHVKEVQKANEPEPNGRYFKGQYNKFDKLKLKQEEEASDKKYFKRKEDDEEEDEEEDDDDVDQTHHKGHPNKHDRDAGGGGLKRLWEKPQNKKSSSTDSNGTKNLFIKRRGKKGDRGKGDIDMKGLDGDFRGENDDNIEKYQYVNYIAAEKYLKKQEKKYSHLMQNKINNVRNTVTKANIVKENQQDPKMNSVAVDIHKEKQNWVTNQENSKSKGMVRNKDVVEEMEVKISNVLMENEAFFKKKQVKHAGKLKEKKTKGAEKLKEKESKLEEKKTKPAEKVKENEALLEGIKTKSTEKIKEKEAKLKEKKTKHAEKLNKRGTKLEEKKTKSAEKLKEIESKLEEKKAKHAEKVKEKEALLERKKTRSTEQIKKKEAKLEEKKTKHAEKLNERETKSEEKKTKSAEKLKEIESKLEEQKTKHAKKLKEKEAKLEKKNTVSAEKLKEKESKIEKKKSKLNEKEQISKNLEKNSGKRHDSDENITHLGVKLGVSQASKKVDKNNKGKKNRQHDNDAQSEEVHQHVNFSKDGGKYSKSHKIVKDFDPKRMDKKQFISDFKRPNHLNVKGDKFAKEEDDEHFQNKVASTFNKKIKYFKNEKYDNGGKRVKSTVINSQTKEKHIDSDASFPAPPKFEDFVTEKENDRKVQDRGDAKNSWNILHNEERGKQRDSKWKDWKQSSENKKHYSEDKDAWLMRRSQTREDHRSRAEDSRVENVVENLSPKTNSRANDEKKETQDKIIGAQSDNKVDDKDSWFMKRGQERAKQRSKEDASKIMQNKKHRSNDADESESKHSWLERRNDEREKHRKNARKSEWLFDRSRQREESRNENKRSNRHVTFGNENYKNVHYYSQS